MAKIHQVKHKSNYEFLPQREQETLDSLPSIDELKNRDYVALSSALLKKGEFKLLHGDFSGLRFFDMALKLDPANAEMLFQQGLALFEYGSEEGKEKALTLASKRFKMTTGLNPDSFDAWHAWGNTLYLLGVRKNEPSYFFNAKKKYEKAIKLSSDEPYDALADLYWDYGNLWAKLAEQSEEATDLNLALKAYDKASRYQDDLSSEFWLSFGDASMKLGEQTNDLRLFIKGINCYKNSISLTISSHEGWLKLAKALKALYSYTHDDDHFSQGNECFATSAQLQPQDAEIWVEWAELLLEGGQCTHDIKKLRSSIEKCQKGYRLSHCRARILSTWSEALACLGILSERLELIYEAQNKAQAIDEDDPTFFYPAGMCLMALGIYFKDPDFHYQAIEKFQEGLSQNRVNHKLWYALASAYLAAALLDHDEKSFERSAKFFERALNLKVTSSCHYHYGVCLLKFGELSHEQHHIEQAIYHFEQALNQQKNAAYIHPDWLFQYACALDLIGEFIDNEANYVKALDILNHILMLNPDFPRIHHQIALVHSHYAELSNEPEVFQSAFHHYRIAHQRDKENDTIILDWGVTLLNLAELIESSVESDQYFRDAEYKMIQAARLGNVHAYYSLGCLYSILGEYQRALNFLEKAQAFDSLPSAEELLEDEWLEGLRETEAFQAFLQKVESHQQTFEN